MSTIKMLSIIVPVYNVEKYLERCMQSLLQQDYENIEIILVDDGSQDSSGQLCEDYAEKYSQVKVIHQENAGLGAARNTGVAAAKGDYIAFVDSDDWIKSDMFTKLMAIAVANPEVEMVKCGYCETDASSQERAVLFSGAQFQRIVEKDNLCRYYGKGAPWVVSWNTVYRKDLAKRVKFPPGLYHEDNYASFFYLYFSHACIIINEPLYCYWQNPTSITRDLNKQNKRNQDKIEVFARLLDYVVTQDALKNSIIKKKLQNLWAKAYYHRIRDDRNIKKVPQGVLNAIYQNLDWRRKLQLRYYVIKRGICIDASE